MLETIAIVGASMAGGTAAATLREQGFDGRVVLIGAEPEPPYERPPLSKELLRGESTLEDALIRPAGFWEEQSIETRFGVSVDGVDPVVCEIELAGSGERLRYDRLLVSTGARNRRLPIPGIDLDGVLDLRTVGDAERIRARLSAGARAVVVGMGFVGSEVAASLRQSGLEVTAIELARTPLAETLGAEVGGTLAAAHADRGVAMRFGEGIAAFEGEGRLERVVTDGGTSIEADLAVVALGVEPVTDLLEGSGVELDRGVLVDEHCRTSVEGIYAAGDVANHFHPLAGRHLRVEHWQNAMMQGEHAARSMLGDTTPYDEVHWFWSDQYEHHLQWGGLPGPWDEVVVRGSLEDRTFTAFYLKDGLLNAAASLDYPKEVRRAMKVVAARVAVDPRVLSDPEADLRELVPARS